MVDFHILWMLSQRKVRDMSLGWSGSLALERSRAVDRFSALWWRRSFIPYPFPLSSSHRILGPGRFDLLWPTHDNQFGDAVRDLFWGLEACGQGRSLSQARHLWQGRGPPWRSDLLHHHTPFVSCRRASATQGSILGCPRFCVRRELPAIRRASVMRDWLPVFGRWDIICVQALLRR